MARIFSDNAPQMYFARFFCSLDRWEMTRLEDIGLVSRLDAGKHTISLQSCVVLLNFVPQIFHTAYRLSRIGSELFEALNPEARSLLLHARNGAMRSGASKKSGNDIFTGSQAVTDVQYVRLGDQLSFLI